MPEAGHHEISCWLTRWITPGVYCGFKSPGRTKGNYEVDVKREEHLPDLF
jgi:hypothetical protein